MELLCLVVHRPRVTNMLLIIQQTTRSSITARVTGVAGSIDTDATGMSDCAAHCNCNFIDKNKCFDTGVFPVLPAMLGHFQLISAVLVMDHTIRDVHVSIIALHKP